MFHTTQLVLTDDAGAVSGPHSEWRVRVLNCSRTTPPCPWTMPLGIPVVPEEKSTQSGSLKSTSSAVHAALPTRPRPSRAGA